MALDFKFGEGVSLEVMTKIRLKVVAAANQKFKEASSYMFIFGKGHYFELSVDDMENVDENSGIIFRPSEADGVMTILSWMVKVNFNKKILTIMSATAMRPKNWQE